MYKSRALKLLILLFTLYFSKSESQNYTSLSEENLINSYQKDSINYDFLKSLFIIDSTFSEVKYTNYKNKLDKIISQLPEKESSAKKEKKRIKKIYDIVHSTFLKKYDEKAMFSDIFSNGHYNCVSASAIYAYTFDQIGIPYHVKEAPSHVYLIAYPDSHKIRLETTVPGSYGFIILQDSEIKKVVDELINVKLVTKEEVFAKGYKKFYEDYFYGKEYVAKSSLIGMQYYNKGYYDLEIENYKSALNNVTKSSIFYNSPTTNYLRKQLLLLNLSKLDFKDDNDLNILYTSLTELKYNEDIDSNNVNVLLNTITDNRNNEFILKAAKVLSSLEEPELNALCQFELYNYLVRDNATKQNLDQTIKYGEIVLKLDSINKLAKKAITYSVYQKVYIMPLNDKVLITLDSLTKKFNFINEDKGIITIRARLYGQLTEQKILERKINEGMKYFISFENLLETERENIQINPQAITHLYLLVGRYYYGKSQFKSAKTFFEKGLKYNPDNYDLKKMLKWTKEDMR